MRFIAYANGNKTAETRAVGRPVRADAIVAKGIRGNTMSAVSRPIRADAIVAGVDRIPRSGMREAPEVIAIPAEGASAPAEYRGSDATPWLSFMFDRQPWPPLLRAPRCGGATTAKLESALTGLATSTIASALTGLPAAKLESALTGLQKADPVAALTGVQAESYGNENLLNLLK
jgi:hypothetical protein